MLYTFYLAQNEENPHPLICGTVVYHAIYYVYYFVTVYTNSMITAVFTGIMVAFKCLY